MQYFIIAGEASGDLHAANLVNEIIKLDESAVFKGVGGEHMQKASVDILFGLDRLAFMGFYEVLKNLRTINQNFNEVKQSILTYKPDVIILIDYPGFNLRMAKWCKHHGFKVVYYIAPQIWAWNEKRVEIIKKNVDLVLCILPFEVAFYTKHNYTNAHFVGHPLLDSQWSLVESQWIETNQSSIALLPGSRKQEITKLLPIYLELANQYPNEQFVIAGISRLKHLYNYELPQNVIIKWNSVDKILLQARAAVVCSGTATLETALRNVPQVVCYKTSWLNYQIGKRLAKVDFISLPNLIADKKIITELIQQDCTVESIKTELDKLLNTSNLNFYEALFEKIGEKGASENAAKLIINYTAIK